MQLGNGRWESTQFNSRLQPTQIALGKTQNAADLLDLDYTYGTNQNNGNVLSQTITVPTVGAATGFTAIQNYSYDSLNRIKDATETIASTETWKQAFTFDRYGNRNFVTGSGQTSTLGSCPTAVCNPSINPNDNKITSTGYSFDAVGNTKTDAEGRTFIYDSENKQVEVKSSSNVTVGQYFYDGDGKRIKKISTVNNITTEEVFVYDAAGKLIGEYSNEVVPQEQAKVAYLTNDHLSSPRINTDMNGKVTSRHDYRPFGEEIAASQRTTGLDYADDTVRKQFTGYERDAETSLDFAQARFFASTLGRFQSPDDFLNDTHPVSPQQWNLYVYGRNNPLRYSDPTGKKAKVTIDRDEKTKKGTILIEAKFLVYAAPGQKVTAKQLDRQRELIGKQIKESFTKKGMKGSDGVKYDISTKITVEAAANEADAINTVTKDTAGAGQYNLVEIGSKQVYDSRRGESAHAATYSQQGESFDRMKVSLHNEAVIASGNTYAHEFTHALGSGRESTKSTDLRFLGRDTPSAISADDFTYLFEKQINMGASGRIGIRTAPVRNPNEVNWK
jgi:RHS repeat-associated protein